MITIDRINAEVLVVNSAAKDLVALSDSELLVVYHDLKMPAQNLKRSEIESLIILKLIDNIGEYPDSLLIEILNATQEPIGTKHKIVNNTPYN